MFFRVAAAATRPKHEVQTLLWCRKSIPNFFFFRLAAVASRPKQKNCSDCGGAGEFHINYANIFSTTRRPQADLQHQLLSQLAFCSDCGCRNAKKRGKIKRLAAAATLKNLKNWQKNSNCGSRNSNKMEKIVEKINKLTMVKLQKQFAVENQGGWVEKNC